MTNLSKKEIFNKIWKFLNPVDTFKYFFNIVKKHKMIALIAILFTLLSTAHCVNLSGFSKFWEGDFILEDVLADVKINLDGGEGIDKLGAYTRSIYDALVSVGASLAILMWFVGFMELSLRADLTPELIIRDFIKIVLTVLIIDKWGYDILKGVLDFNDSVYDGIKNVLDAKFKTEEIILGGFPFDLRNVPLTKAAMVLLAVLSLVVLKIYYNICIAVALWQRKAKILVYLSLAPLGLYDFRDGFHSASANFIRKFFALCLQGVIILVINKLINAILLDTLVSGLIIDGTIASSLLTVIKLAPLVLVMSSFLKQTEQMAGTFTGATFQ